MLVSLITAVLGTFIMSVIETCPAIIIPEKEVELIDKTILFHYYYYWHDGTGEHAAMVLGYGSLYNHSYHPNAMYVKNYEKKVVEIVALRDIPANTEITVNYNGTPDSLEPLWFDSVTD